MSVIAILQTLLEHDLAIEQQCELLKQTSPEKLDGEMLYQATEYLYDLIQAPTKSINAVDIVGTGGDQKGLFNISTASSFVIAGMGIPVLKHGNTKMSSQSGSMDCLNALSIKLPKTPTEALHQFNQTQLCFLFAQHFYAVFSKVTLARKKLAEQNIKTIFNVLGPLLNPLRPTHQLIGVSQKSLLIPMSESLVKLGRKGFVFCCQNADELIPGEDMNILKVDTQGVQAIYFECDQHKISPLNVNHLKGGCPNTNAQYLRHILESKLSGPFSQVILFNAAFAGMIYHDLSFENAYSHAQESLSSGAALKKYHEVKKT